MPISSTRFFAIAGIVGVTVTPEKAIVEYVRAYLPQDEKPGQQNGQVDYRYTLSTTP